VKQAWIHWGRWEAGYKVSSATARRAACPWALFRDGVGVADMACVLSSRGVMPLLAVRLIRIHTGVVACFRTDRTQALQPVAHITPPFGRTEAGVSETSSILFLDLRPR
jgi:hypothetical protein